MDTMLFIGGCRSGKSSLAKKWAEARGGRRAFVATLRVNGIADDEEMKIRIERHRRDRGDGWFCVEPDEISPQGPFDAVDALAKAAESADAIVFDCVTMWLSAYIANERAYSDEIILDRVKQLGAWLANAPVPTAVVTNEVGCGVVPVMAMGRRFRDLAGFANQHLASCCIGVTLAVCGLPFRVK